MLLAKKILNHNISNSSPTKGAVENPDGVSFWPFIIPRYAWGISKYRSSNDRENRKWDRLYRSASHVGRHRYLPLSFSQPRSWTGLPQTMRDGDGGLANAKTRYLYRLTRSATRYELFSLHSKTKVCCYLVLQERARHCLEKPSPIYANTHFSAFLPPLWRPNGYFLSMKAHS